MEFLGADHGPGKLFEIHAAVMDDGEQFAIQVQRLLLVAPGLFKNVVNAVAMSLFDGADRLGGVPTKPSKNFTDLLGMEQRLRRLRRHKGDQRNAVGAGDHEARMGVPNNAGKFGLQDLVKHRNGGSDVKVGGHGEQSLSKTGLRNAVGAKALGHLVLRQHHRYRGTNFV